MRPLLLPIVFAACVSTEPAGLCTTVSSERVRPSEPMPELDGLSVDAWFASVADGLSWDITWSGPLTAPADDVLTLHLEREGLPTLEEERSVRPDTPDTPPELAGRCLDGLFIRTAVRASVQTDSGVQAAADADLVLFGADLSSARLTLQAPASIPAALEPDPTQTTCPAMGEPVFTVERAAGLADPTGAVGTEEGTCSDAWATWQAVSPNAAR